MKKRLEYQCAMKISSPILGFGRIWIVENVVIVELKAVEKVLPVHKKQLLTYLRLTGMKLGLLVNFNVNLIKVELNGLSMAYRILSIQCLCFSLRSLRLCARQTRIVTKHLQ